ncbi:transporter substrate-binding domain-containing protein [Aureliella helgolandensis]|uniref:Glutamine-binding periplasmic protein n=1 Tax=Aureliella helgolandensis TaxID=2527968 RepID=A0A518GDE4_9BACT|nr:transporter substrate-binding domain-containing protein [Aureliella helgolandensis]QDV26578.1 Glutamine-binding periplasmic protein precursor [Aureliella helgolandensis]
MIDVLRFYWPALVFLLLSGSSALHSLAQEPSATINTEITEDSSRVVLKVGTKHSPPFAIKNPDGSWTGISIELWKHLTDELNLEFQFEELPLDEILDKLETCDLDAAVAAISVTSERHERVGFCHPHFSTGLGIAISSRERTGPGTILRRVVSSGLVKLMLTMVGIVIVCGFLFWIFERNRNTTMFGGKRRQGIGMGVWWSTTLLLGNKGVVPASSMGRLLAALAMFSSIIVVSTLTGVITSVLTVQQLDTGIARVADLHHVRVATINDSTSADYLRQRHIFFRAYQTPEAAIQAVDDNQADAVVYDAALLKYLASEQFINRIDIVPVLFNVQEYAIALCPGSNLRRPLNEELLRYRESDAWDELVYRYLGE